MPTLSLSCRRLAAFMLLLPCPLLGVARADNLPSGSNAIEQQLKDVQRKLETKLETMEGKLDAVQKSASDATRHNADVEKRLESIANYASKANSDKLASLETNGNWTWLIVFLCVAGMMVFLIVMSLEAWAVSARIKTLVDKLGEAISADERTEAVLERLTNQTQGGSVPMVRDVFPPASKEDLQHVIWISGQNLSAAEKVEVGGKNCRVLAVHNESITVKVPQLAQGNHDVKVKFVGKTLKKFGSYEIT